MNEQQYFEQFSGESMLRAGGGVVATGELYYVGEPISRLEIYSNDGQGKFIPATSVSYSWKFPVDDNGNPPPHGIYGDIIPTWYDGRWWVCNADLEKRKRELGDK